MGFSCFGVFVDTINDGDVDASSSLRVRSYHFSSSVHADILARLSSTVFTFFISDILAYEFSFYGISSIGIWNCLVRLWLLLGSVVICAFFDL
jgi:hypothetical protein